MDAIKYLTDRFVEIKRFRPPYLNESFTNIILWKVKKDFPLRILLGHTAINYKDLRQDDSLFLAQFYNEVLKLGGKNIFLVTVIDEQKINHILCDSIYGRPILFNATGGHGNKGELVVDGATESRVVFSKNSIVLLRQASK